jgi:hypothetical protein
MLCILRHHPLVFSLLHQNLQVLQEDNSCHTCEYCTNFCRCLPKMPIVLFMLFLSYFRGRMFLFCVCDVWGSNRYLCASLHSIWNNFAHLCEYCANIWGDVGGMYKLVKVTKKAGNLRLIGGRVRGRDLFLASLQIFFSVFEGLTTNTNSDEGRSGGGGGGGGRV